MTISSTGRRAGPFVGNDATTQFPFDFKVFAAADLRVVRRASASGVETVLALGTDYTVALNADQRVSPGGAVTLPAALASGQTLTLTSAMANLQPLDLTNGGGFYPRTINDALDRLTILIQQVAEQAARAVKQPLSDAGGAPDLPALDQRRGRVLAFDAVSGNPVAGPTITDITAVVAAVGDIHAVAYTLPDIHLIAGTYTEPDGLTLSLSVTLDLLNLYLGKPTSVPAFATLMNGLVAGRKLGDITNDGAISLSDSLAALKYYLGKTGEITADSVTWIETQVIPALAADPALAGYLTQTYVSEISAVALAVPQLLAVADYLDEIAAVTPHVANLDALAPHVAAVGTVAGSVGGVNTVATNIGNVNTVATNIGNVNTCAGNLAAIINAPTQATNAAASAQAAADDLAAFESVFQPHDMYWNHVTLLAHLDGAPFGDARGHAITNIGDVTAMPNGRYGYCARFDGGPKALRTAESWDFHLASDFTIECWVKPSVPAYSTGALLALHEAGATSPDFVIKVAMSNDPTIGTFSAVGDGLVLSSGPYFVNTGWFHVAVTRAGNSAYLFVNGVMVNIDEAVSGPVVTAGVNGVQCSLGAFRSDNHAAYYLAGDLDEVRVTNGYARYLANFTPPDAPHPDGGSVLAAELLSVYGPFELTGDLVQIGEGGTGATTAAGARANLGLGGMATQSANTVAIEGGSINNTPIEGGSINNTPIGQNTPAYGRFSSLSASVSFGLPGTVTPDVSAYAGGMVWDLGTGMIKVGTGSGTKTLADTDSAQTLANKTLTAPTVNGGTLDGATLGATTPAPATVTALTVTGNTTLGDAAADTVTINASTLDCPNGLGLGVTPSAWNAVYSRVLQLGNGGGYIAGRADGAAIVQTGSNGYFDGTNWRYITSSGAGRHVINQGTHSWETAPTGTAGNIFVWTTEMTLDANGNLLVGVASGGNHKIKRAAATAASDAVLHVEGGSGTSTVTNDRGAAGSISWNASDACFAVASATATGRSIKTAGTVNTGGADYAEYRRKHPGCGPVAKGQIVGYDRDGLVTDRWSRAVVYRVKSTNPSYVGGDTWGNEDRVGRRPEPPIDVAPEGEDAVAEAEAEHAAAQAQYEVDLAAWQSRLEAARQGVDRIAYAGVVPVNVLDATPGDYIVAVAGADDAIAGAPVAPDALTWEQYRQAVGRCITILPDGRAEIDVMVH